MEVVCMPGILEICCTSFDSARNAERGGANRIELCDNILEGGTTPSLGMIKLIKQGVAIGLYVLIRPRGGDFVYSDEEFEIMLADIDSCKISGVDGIVSGVLLKNGAIDIERTKQLVERSGKMGFTFHRAFDMVNNANQALRDVIGTGASRILTSGLENNVVQGINMLRTLVELANGEIVIMPGGGLKAGNMAHIISQTACKEYHSSAKAWVPSASDNNSHVRMNGLAEIPEDLRMISSLEEVRKMRNILDENLS